MKKNEENEEVTISSVLKELISISEELDVGLDNCKVLRTYDKRFPNKRMVTGIYDNLIFPLYFLTERNRARAVAGRVDEDGKEYVKMTKDGDWIEVVDM